MRIGQYVVFYDGRCPLCRRARQWLEQRQGAPLRFVNIHNWIARLRWPQIDWRHAESQVQVIRPEGRIDKGFRAVVTLLSTRSRLIRFFEPIFRVWPVRVIGQIFYHAVSVNRYPIGHALFERGNREQTSTGVSVMKLKLRRREPIDLLKGSAAGAIGGLVGALSMNLFQMAISKVVSLPQTQGEQEAQETEDQEEHDATVKTAKMVSRRVLHRELNEKQAKAGGAIVHFGFGTIIGCVYGALAEVVPAAKIGMGTGYGISVWAGVDEALLPLTGLTKPPTEYLASVHLNALGSHIVYGATLELVRGFVRERL